MKCVKMTGENTTTLCHYIKGRHVGTIISCMKVECEEMLQGDTTTFRYYAEERCVAELVCYKSGKNEVYNNHSSLPVIVCSSQMTALKEVFKIFSFLEHFFGAGLCRQGSKIV